MKPMKVELVYFTPRGKYYTTASYDTMKVHLWEVWEEVVRMRDSGDLPGLIKRTADNPNFDEVAAIISVDVPKHPHRHPNLIVKEGLSAAIGTSTDGDGHGDNGDVSQSRRTYTASPTRR